MLRVCKAGSLTTKPHPQTCPMVEAISRAASAVKKRGAVLATRTGWGVPTTKMHKEAMECLVEADTKKRLKAEVPGRGSV